MVFDALRLALPNLFASETRSVLWKVIGLALLSLLALWFALRSLFLAFALPWIDSFLPGIPEWAGWLTFIFGILASVGLALTLALLMAPVTAIIAGLFLDDVAGAVEGRDYPNETPGHALPFGAALWGSIKFLGVVVVGNLFALLLLFVPGVNLIAFFLVNGYLLGREFFEFAAMRFRPPEEARLFRAKHSSTVLMAGFVIAGFLAIPILNLLTPLFAASLMVHLHKLLSRHDPGFPG